MSVSVEEPPNEERIHFKLCQECGEYFDMRQLDEVMFHNIDHKPRPDIQYGGSERLNRARQKMPKKAKAERRGRTAELI